MIIKRIKIKVGFFVILNFGVIFRLEVVVGARRGLRWDWFKGF